MANMQRTSEFLYHRLGPRLRFSGHTGSKQCPVVPLEGLPDAIAIHAERIAHLGRSRHGGAALINGIVDEPGIGRPQALHRGSNPPAIKVIDGEPG
jgi:hypothetical protein